MGLLARANALLEKEQQKDELELQQLATAHQQLLKNLATPRRHKLRKLALGAMLGLTLTTATSPATLNHPLSHTDLGFEKPQQAEMVDLQDSLHQFQQGLTSRVSDAERDLIAQMVYGEAGRGADPFEVIHTVLNRMSSPLFSGNAADVVTQKNQYVGYKNTHPVTRDYRRMVDMAVDDWEAHGCQIDGCGHFYFVTDPRNPGKANLFEDAPTANYQGQWVEPSQKKYAHDYCDVAKHQAARFFAERDRGL